MTAGKITVATELMNETGLHHAGREQQMPLLLGEHLLLAAARLQHQEAQRSQDGGHQQTQEDVLPAALWKKSFKQRFTETPVSSSGSRMTQMLLFTWYLCPSIPVKIDVEVAKQHAVTERKEKKKKINI